MMRAPVVICDYDPHWPRLFEEERAAILGAIDDAAVVVEHVGSTAVPGLGAKPIIDIMVGVRRLADANRCIEPLGRFGYEYVPEYEAEMPERRYLRKGPAGARTHHLHMVEYDGAFWQRHIFFRDYLRAHPDVAQEYERVKRTLAAQLGRESYTEAKTSFIRAVEARTRRSA